MPPGYWSLGIVRIPRRIFLCSRRKRSRAENHEQRKYNFLEYKVWATNVVPYSVLMCSEFHRARFKVFRDHSNNGTAAFSERERGLDSHAVSLISLLGSNNNVGWTVRYPERLISRQYVEP